MRPDRSRYAVYYAPSPEHPLWQAGCQWLGRDARTGWAQPDPVRGGVEAARRYGFHATLKAPIVLADEAGAPEFLQAVRRLASTRVPFPMPALEVAKLGRFLALCPTEAPAPDHPLRQLAAACVLTLDRWRAPLTLADTARRLPACRHDAERDHLERFGYPYVLDRWRFHMTLSDAEACQDDLAEAAARHFAAALACPLTCDALCVFVEPRPGAAFEWAHTFAFQAG